MKLVFAAIAFAALSSNPQGALAQTAPQREAAPASAVAPASTCTGCGTVTAIRPTALRGEPQWKGTISAGPSGTTGTGNRPFTGYRLGTPLPGQEEEPGTRQRTIYEVVVLMEDQTTRKLHYEHRPALSVGDRVRVSGDEVYLR